MMQHSRAFENTFAGVVSPVYYAAGQIDGLDAVAFEQLASYVAAAAVGVQHERRHEEQLLGNGCGVRGWQRQSVHQSRDCTREEAVVRGQHAQLVIQIALGLSDGPAQIQMNGGYGLRKAVAQLLQLKRRRDDVPVALSRLLRVSPSIGTTGCSREMSGRFRQRNWKNQAINFTSALETPPWADLLLP